MTDVNSPESEGTGIDLTFPRLSTDEDRFGEKHRLPVNAATSKPKPSNNDVILSSDRQFTKSKYGVEPEGNPPDQPAFFEDDASPNSEELK